MYKIKGFGVVDFVYVGVWIKVYDYMLMCLVNNWVFEIDLEIDVEVVIRM